MGQLVLRYVLEIVALARIDITMARFVRNRHLVNHRIPEVFLAAKGISFAWPRLEVGGIGVVETLDPEHARGHLFGWRIPLLGRRFIIRDFWGRVAMMVV